MRYFCSIVFLLVLLTAACSDGLLNFEGGSGGGGGSGSSAGGSIGTKLNGKVLSILLETNGTGALYIAGEFTSFDNLSAPRIARLTNAGGLDTSFNPGTGFDNRVNQLIHGANNTIYAVGNFDTYNGASAPKVVRLGTDGGTDASFAVGAVNSEVTGISLSSALVNHVYIVGPFTTVGVTAIPYAAKLTSLGNLDSYTSSFDSTNPPPRKILRQASMENFLVVGDFTTYAAGIFHRIVRLDSLGANDPTFANGIGGGSDASIRNIIQDNTNFYIVGDFSSFGAAPRIRMARLSTFNGANDGAFSPSAFNDVAKAVALSGINDSVYVGGAFTTYGGVARARIIRVQSNGGQDLLFSVAGFNTTVEALAVDTANDLLYVGGEFTSYGTTASHNLIRLHSDGSVDTSF